MDAFFADNDTDMGKVLKYYKPNPLGQDMYLKPDGTIESDEDKIRKVQRIFKHNYWCPDGPGTRRVMKKYVSWQGQGPEVEGVHQQTKMFSTHVIISDLTPENSPPLMPTPSVLDEFSPPATPTRRSLLEGPLEITSTYRGRLMYLENGCMVYRSHPKSPGGNGMVTFPLVESAEPETCYVEFNEKWWQGTLNFVSCPAESV